MVWQISILEGKIRLYKFKNHIVAILFLLCFFSVNFQIKENKDFKKDEKVARNKHGNISAQKITIRFSQQNSSLAFDSKQGINYVKIIQFIPKYGLDFRIYNSLNIRIYVDGEIRLDSSIANYIPENQKMNEKRVSINEEFSNFKTLVIEVYDESNENNFVFDSVIYVR